MTWIWPRPQRSYATQDPISRRKKRWRHASNRRVAVPNHIERELIIRAELVFHRLETGDELNEDLRRGASDLDRGGRTGFGTGRIGERLCENDQVPLAFDRGPKILRECLGDVLA